MRVLCILFLFISNLSPAQKVVKEFYDKEGQITVPEKSHYYLVGKKGKVKKKEGDWFIDSVLTFYSATQRIRSREFYKQGLAEGPYVKYHANGIVKEKGLYEGGDIVGLVTNWYERGTLQREIYRYPYVFDKPSSRDSFQIVNYWDETGKQLIQNGYGYCKCQLLPDETLQEGTVVNGYRDGIWKGVSGDTLTFTEQYEKGAFVKGESVYQGQRFEYMKVFKSAEFIGGLRALSNFIRVNLHYPIAAKREGQQGKIFIRFIIHTDGVLSNYQVLKGVSPVLDTEALRVVILSDKRWIPSESRGVPINKYFVLPVAFVLN